MLDLLSCSRRLRVNMFWAYRWSNKPLPGSRKCLIVFFLFFSSCWSTRGHIGRSTRNSNPIMTSSAGGAKGWSDHRFRSPPAYTAQLLTLHQHRANYRYRTANQILPTLRVSSSTQATLGTVSHPSTNRAQRCLTSVIIRELVFPSW